MENTAQDILDNIIQKSKDEKLVRQLIIEIFKDQKEGK